MPLSFQTWVQSLFAGFRQYAQSLCVVWGFQVLANPHIAIPYVTKDPGALLSGKSALSAAVRCFDHVLPPRPVTTAEGFFGGATLLSVVFPFVIVVLM
jgi:hypothetical protein